MTRRTDEEDRRYGEGSDLGGGDTAFHRELLEEEGRTPEYVREIARRSRRLRKLAEAEDSPDVSDKEREEP